MEQPEQPDSCRFDTLIPRRDDQRLDAAPPTLRQRKSSGVITVAPPAAMREPLEAPIAAMCDAIPDCSAVLVIDIDFRHIVAWRLRDADLRDVDVLSWAASDLFLGERLHAVEAMLEGTAGSFQEMVFSAKDQHLIFIRGEASPSLVVLVVCGADRSLGRILSGSRTHWRRMQKLL